MFDLIISEGMIFDGSGKEGYRADLGILKERVSAMGRLAPEMGHRLIDARDLVVAPGFIDPHTRSDFAVLLDPCREQDQAGRDDRDRRKLRLLRFPRKPGEPSCRQGLHPFLPGELSWQWSDYRGFSGSHDGSRHCL